MDFISLSQEMFEVSFSAEQQVTPVITRDDFKKMIWWLVLFLQIF